MSSYLTFLQGSSEKQINCGVTYLRGPLFDWWENYRLENGYPRDWAELSKALVQRFGSRFRARKALAQLMNFRRGKRKMREYTAEFQYLLNKLSKWDEFWVKNIFIWGLQPQLANL